ncbi:MAG: IS21 family transposase [Anaerovoracaceae bacterium]
MLNLMDKHTVIRLKREKHSDRSVAKLTGIDRRTVGKYWKDYLDKQKEIEGFTGDVSLLQEELLEKPKYDSSKRKALKYSREIDDLMDQIISFEETKDKMLGNHKLGLTAKKIHELIVEAGYDIGKSTVALHLKQKRDKAKECFIRQQYNYADRLEYDFGELELAIAGKVMKFYLAVFSSPASGFRWAYLYKNQKQEVFIESHVRFYEMMGGVYKENVYDNMRNVVSKFIGKNEKEINAELVKLSNYYGFSINVTNCFKGNEKGHVEESVKTVRKDIFSLRYEFDSYEQACDYLEKGLLDLNAKSEIAEEKNYLLAAMPPLTLGKITEQKVNSYSFVHIDTNMYSVPDYLVGKTVTVRTYVHTVKVYASDSFVCEHERKTGSNELSVNIMHYLRTLERKPGAIRNSSALKSIPLLKNIFDDCYSERPKRFIEILVENKDKKIEEIYTILLANAKLSKKAVPIDIVPAEGMIEITTRGLLNHYSQLSVGGVSNGN